MIRPLLSLPLVVTVGVFSPLLAWAAEDAHHEKTKGLPQLDPSSYPTQLFWLFLVFGFLYFFFSRKVLPDISQVLENRHDRIQNDLDTAQRLKEEVEAVQDAYEGNIAKSHGDAAAILRSVEADVKTKAEEQTKRFQENAARKSEELERNLSSARDKAMEDMSQLASEIAVEAAAKIIDQRPDMAEALKIVKSLHNGIKEAKAA